LFILFLLILQKFFPSLKFFILIFNLFLLYSNLQQRNTQYLRSTLPIIRIGWQHSTYDILKITRIPLRQRLVLTTLNAMTQFDDIGTSEGAFQNSQLINDAPKGPDIWFLVVFFVLYLLWRHIIWSTHICSSILRVLS
jgi:hypothetical protein